MKRKLLIKQIALIFFLLFSIGRINAQGVFVSQNCDPHNNYVPDRFAEIYNSTDAAVDLTGWTLENVQNGTVQFTWTLSGTIASGKALVCGNADATNQTISPDFTATWVGNSFNGKGGDGTVLKNASGVVVDSAVQHDATGKFENGHMVRNPDIISPSVNYDASQWTFSAITNAADANPGEHTVNQAGPTAKDLFFSEYVEGSGSNRAIEIFNGTGADVDLSGYTVKQAHNGGGWGVAGSAYALPLSGTVASGDVYVIANVSADTAILAQADTTFDYSTDQGHKIPFFTGNDALGLFKADVLIDVVGVPTESSSWAVAGVAGATQDHTLVRKSTITQGDTVWATSAGTDADNSEWIVFAKDSLAGLGSHTFGEASTPPTWTTNYPKVTQIEDTRATLLVNMNEAGKAYYVVVASGASVPTSAEVKAGVDYGSTTVLQKDTVDVAAANTTVMANITGAQPNTSADIYVVAEDASGNLQSAPVKISVTTTAARSLTIDKPQANATFYLGDTIKIEWTSANIDSLMFSVYPSTPSGISVVFTTGPVAAADGSYNLVIPQNADAGNFRLVLWDAYDSSFKKEVSPITLTDNRQLHWVAPLSGDTVYVGDTAVFKWTSANIDSILIGGYIAKGGPSGGYFMLTGDIDHYDRSYWKPVLASKGVFKMYLDPKNMGGSITLDSLFLYDAADTSFKVVVHPVYILDTFPMQIVRPVPSFGMTDFPASSGISCEFNCDSIVPGAGQIHLKKADGTTVEDLDSNMVNINGNGIWFMPNPALIPGESYYIEIDSGFVKCADGSKTFPGLSGKDWSFSVASSTLYFSEYEEGSSNNKALEIYNPTNHDINLDEYIIGGSYNGSGIQNDVYHFPKGYVLKAGAVFVLANSQADSAILSVTNDTLAYNEGGYVVSFNGNDARALIRVINNGNNWVWLDVIGVPDQSPSSGWDVAGVTAATKDHTLLRKGGIMMGTTDWGASSGSDASSSQWIVKPKNYSDNLGKPTSGVGISNPGLTDNINVFPNPGNGRLNIALNNTLKGNVTVRVMDMTGRVVYKHIFKDIMNQTLPVDISNEPSNLYFISISNGNNMVVKKFMKR